MVEKSHQKRVVQELKAAGMTQYGLIKIETSRLPAIIHDDEHIGGVVYGRTTDDKVGSAMLIATDKRIIFLDAKPFFTTMDEISYDVVSGVKSSKAGLFSAIILHTRVRDYGLRFVNKTCAEKFDSYIESHIEIPSSTFKTIPPSKNQTAISSNVDEYIKEQSTAVLSTVDREGNAHGAVVHYIYQNELFYIVTKKQTNKAQHIIYHGQVALTIHKSNSLKTVQISGLAEEETSPVVVEKIYQEISKPKNYEEGSHFPPVVSMKKGNVTVIRISPINTHYHDYSEKSW